jgi:hypothetical protein
MRKVFENNFGRGVPTRLSKNRILRVKSETGFDQTLASSRRQRWGGGNRLRIGLYQRPEHVDFADIVYQS